MQKAIGNVTYISDGTFAFTLIYEFAWREQSLKNPCTMIKKLNRNLQYWDGRAPRRPRQIRKTNTLSRALEKYTQIKTEHNHSGFSQMQKVGNTDTNANFVFPYIYISIYCFICTI